jgi:hypothetical protein
MTCCHECGQELSEIRLDVRLTPLKVRLFDVIKRAAAGGIISEDLFEIVIADRGDITISNLKSHIWQINNAIKDTGFRIMSRDRHWILTKVQMELPS